MGIVEQFIAIGFADIATGAYPGNFLWRAIQREGNLTGQHVDLVAAGHGDQHISIFNTR